MIINNDREPKYSLYFIGAKILRILNEFKDKTVDFVYDKVNQLYEGNLSIGFFYLGVDWLFLLGKIDIRNGEFEICE